MQRIHRLASRALDRGDMRCDVLSGLGGLQREVLHLGGDHGEPLPASPARAASMVRPAQQVGQSGDRVDSPTTSTICAPLPKNLAPWRRSATPRPPRPRRCAMTWRPRDDCRWTRSVLRLPPRHFERARSLAPSGGHHFRFARGTRPPRLTSTAPQHAASSGTRHRRDDAAVILLELVGSVSIVAWRSSAVFAFSSDCSMRSVSASRILYLIPARRARSHRPHRARPPPSMCQLSREVKSP